MIALLAPLVVQATAPAFAPPLDRALSYSVREVRDDGIRTQRFAVDRHVTFRRTADGFTAEVDLVTVTGEAGRAGELFEAMARAAAPNGRTLLYLDRAGKVVDVADLDVVWDSYLAAVTRAFVGRNPSRSAVIETLLAPLRILPRPARVTRIGEMIAPLIAGPGLVPGATRAITVPARGPDGRREMLAGTERTVAGPDGRLSLERQASGIVAGAPRSMSLKRRIDPATGLVLDTIDVETIETAGARLTVTRSTSIES